MPKDWAEQAAEEWFGITEQTTVVPEEVRQDCKELVRLIRTKAREAGTMAWAGVNHAGHPIPSTVRLLWEDALKLDIGGYTVHPVLVLRMEEKDAG